ncbi:hypothetical protein Syun_000964 [Stephania yunnanensis]|uniref:Uncharacterized protein n=1 Tax=Stephania yunnanensis TaxID=152371 RepID=A0AAP0LGY3_9MAGN
MEIMCSQSVAIVTLSALHASTTAVTSVTPVIQEIAVTTVRAETQVETSPMTLITKISTRVAAPIVMPVAILELTPVQKIIFEKSFSVEAKLIKEFIKLKQRYFYRGGESKITGKWVFAHERIHRLLRIH